MNLVTISTQGHLCLTHSHDPQGQTVPGPRACGYQCPDMEGEDGLGGHTLTRETLRIRVSLALVRQHASTRRKVARGLKMQMSPHLPKTGTDVSPQPRSSSGTQDSSSGTLRTTFRLSAQQLQR